MPRLSQELLDEILSRIDIVEVIAGYIPLKKSGRTFKAVCPFHNEKTPSFIVSSDKQIFHCFGCNAGGNAFNFLMNYERITFYEAVEILAKKSGIVLPKTEDNRQDNFVASLYKINELAVNFYHNFLLNSNEAKLAREYLSKRKIDNKTTIDFKIGFAPNKWQGLIEHLREKNIPISLIEKCGLVIPRDNSGYYDRFRNRIVFPIFDLKKRPVAFSARVLDDSLPKYLNSCDTPVFSKGKVLYGFSSVKEHLRDYDYLLIVEGNFDFISLIQAGFLNTVATLGTALTSDHAKTIKRFTKKVKVLFDSDKAGELATLRSFDVFIEEGLDLEVVTLDEGLDPDSYIKKMGAKGLKDRLDNSLDFFDYKFSILESKFDKKTLKGKSEIAREMLEMLKKIDNEILRSEYVKKLSEYLNVGEQVLIDEFKRVKTGKNLIDSRINNELPENTLSAEMLLLKLALKDLDLLYKLKEHIAPHDFNDSRIVDIINGLFGLVSKGEEINISKLMSCFQDKEHINILSRAMLSDEVGSGNTEDSSLIKLFDDCVKRIKDDKIKLRRKNLQEQIKDAQAKNDQNKLNSLLVEFQSCFTQNLTK